MTADLPREAVTQLIAGRYSVLRELARGSSGEVLLAQDQSTGREVALKRQLPRLRTSAGALSFVREYHALSGLRHPHIIEVYDSGMDGDAPFYTMELLHRHELSELSALPYREACSYLRDVASSLALLHDRRLLHRDVSPRNIPRTHDGRCKLIDFSAQPIPEPLANGLGRLAEVRHCIEQTRSHLQGEKTGRLTEHERRDLTIGLLLLRDAAAASSNPAVHALAQRLSEERGAPSELPPIHADGRQAG